MTDGYDDLLARVGGMPPGERDRVMRLANRLAGGESPGEFIARVWPSQPPPDHVAPILAAMNAARLRPQRVLISMPPRHAKTTTIERCIAWWLKCFPGDTCAYISYNNHKAWKHSRNIRAIAREIGIPLKGSVREPDARDDVANSVGEWRTVHGGGLLAAGSRGGITGHGVHGLMVYDDPYANREEAASDAINGRVVDQFMDVVYTRLEGASVFVVHTRWTPNDLIGQLAQKAGWTVIRLPAIAERDDLVGRLPGEALWPRFYPLNRAAGGPEAKEYLEEIRSQLGDWRFAALYQQRPQPEGQILFRDPALYDASTFSLNGWTVWIGADPAASEKKRADHGAMVALAARGLKELREGRVLEAHRGHWTVPEYTRQLRQFQQKWFNAAAAVEAVAGFKAVPQLLRELDGNLRVTELHPSVDKFQRATPVAAAWNSARCQVPACGGIVSGRQITTAWVPPFVKEVCAFTGSDGEEDDQVDALSHGWNAGVEYAPVTRKSVPQPSRWR